MNPDDFSDSDDEEIGDNVCAICDDGGDILCCDGPCLRSFHATRQAAAKSTSKCISLGLQGHELLEASFFCANCKYKQHQCFACGKLGRSEGENKTVYLCDVALCGYFYHLPCVAKLGVKMGREGFNCPRHKCRGCSKGPEAGDLFPCRRCPQAWHRGCVDRRITFCDEETRGKELTRGWIVGEAKFLYCMKHEIVESLNTPRRNHLAFPARDDRVVQPLKTKRDHFVKLKFPPEEVENVVLEVVKGVNSTIQKGQVLEKLMAVRTAGRSKAIHISKCKSLLRSVTKASECLARGDIKGARCILPRKELENFESMRDDLRSYLMPVLTGRRYSSYGRFFTQLEKLQEVVARLHFHIAPGDMIVDLCCGRNDFSSMMAEKLSQTGKKCFFKNFDIIQPANTFNFEQRDYLTIKNNDLFRSDKLVVGLNPPFGHLAQAASTFVRYVCKFAPKLIVLIVPPETESPAPNYELIWRCKDLLRGEAFYLPGSVDVNGKSMNQELNNPPYLTLWCRSDFAGHHKAIAREHGLLYS